MPDEPGSFREVDMRTHWRKRAIVIVLGVMIASAQTAAWADGPSTQPGSGAGFAQPAPAAGDLTNLSIEQLLNVPIISPAGLTATDVRHLPVDVTELDARDIEESGARDLDTLFEDYVPNEQLMEHNTPGDDMGFRGIISDREDKYLYQVNGVTLNNRMLYGANIERDLPLLGDINTVDVVSGPASATYGSGALAGVIDVNTFSGLTFQGADVGVRQGLIDQYTATEARYGQKINDDSGLFVYYGFADVTGADAPYYIGESETAANGLPANKAGQPYGGPKADLNAPAFGAPFQKAFASYVTGPWDFWVRFTQDGMDTEPRRDIYTKTIPSGDSLSAWTNGREIENQQVSAAARFKEDLSPTFNLQLLEAYDIWIAKDMREGITIGDPIRVSDENQLDTQAIGTWTPVESQSLAFGSELSHIWYHDPPQSDALDATPVVTDRYWQTDTVSFFAEDQWKIDKQWTTFLSLRTDKNTYSRWLLSPRVTVVYAPTPMDTIKFIAGKAVRRGDDEDLFGEYKRTGTYASPETLGTLEAAYEHKLDDSWTVSGNTFFEDYYAKGWDAAATADTSLGHYQIAGGQLLLTYRTQATRVTLSEGVSKETFASVPGGSPAASETISSAPYGFGNDLADWAPSITKLAITHDFNRQWTGSGSIVYYSGFPGARDYAQYTATLAKPPSGVPLSDPGNVAPYGPNVYVNMGLEFHPNEHWTFRVDGYDLAALADQKISKRNEILRESEYNVQPATVAMSIRYSF